MASDLDSWMSIGTMRSAYRLRGFAAARLGGRYVHLQVLSSTPYEKVCKSAPCVSSKLAFGRLLIIYAFGSKFGLGCFDR